MAKDFKITEEMKSNIGWTSDPWIFEVSRTSVRAFARGVGYTDRVFYDIDAATEAGYRDLPAPSTYLGTAVFIPGESKENLPGAPKSTPVIDHGLTGLLDGGTEIEYFDQICAGDTLSCVNKLADLFTKESKGLGTMLIVAGEATYTNQEGDVVAVARTQAIYY